MPKYLFLNTTKGPSSWQSSAVCFTPNSTDNPQYSCGLFILPDNVFETTRAHPDLALQEMQCCSIRSPKTWLREVFGGNIYKGLQIKQSSRCRKSRFACPLPSGGVQNSCSQESCWSIHKSAETFSLETFSLPPVETPPVKWEKSQDLLHHRGKCKKWVLKSVVFGRFWIFRLVGLFVLGLQRKLRGS